LGGKDVYSGSKGAAELIIRCYLHSFFRNAHPVRIAVGRAGNVIGGGDWARDRIVADCMRAWNSGLPVDIRNPLATRPWQHVLEPLSGYLWLALSVLKNQNLHGEAYNFGPRSGNNHTVADLIQDLARNWGLPDPATACAVKGVAFHEAGLLKLNCDKALVELGWQPTLGYREMTAMVSDWYRSYYSKTGDMFAVTLQQIADYERFALEQGQAWSAAS
jgi:CDP-glucose 4,6-dehydratase